MSCFSVRPAAASFLQATSTFRAASSSWLTCSAATPHLPDIHACCCHVPAGDIDFEEFKQLVYDGMLLEGAIQEYEDAFNAVDDSGNGSIGEGACSMQACVTSLR
jgi:hypothetical protein